MNNLFGIVKTLKNKWHIISAVLLILAIAIILIKSNNLTAFRANGAMITIAMEDSYDVGKLTATVNAIDSNATINHIESDNAVNIITTTKEKANEIFNVIKADFSLTAEEADISGDLLFKPINFNITAVISVIGVCLIFSFIIFSIMAGYKYALSNLISNIIGIILALAVFLIFNLSLDMSFISIVFLSIVLIFYFDMSNSIVIKEKIKKSKKFTLNDIVDYLYENTIGCNLIILTIILCSLIVLSIVIPSLLRYALSMLIVIALSLYFSYFLTNPLWLKLKKVEKPIK